MEQRRKVVVPLTMLVSYSCGCKFTTRKESEAKAHAVDTGHTLTVNGTIGPIKQQVQITGETSKDGNAY